MHRKTVFTLLLTASATLVSSRAKADEVETIVRALASTSVYYWSPSLSPDGREVAYVSTETGAPQVWVATLNGDRRRRITFAKDELAGRVLWSPVGDRLAFSLATNGGRHRQVFVSDVHGRNRKRITDGMQNSNQLECWTPDGRQLAIASDRIDAGAMDVFLYARGELRLIAKNPNLGALRSFAKDSSSAVLWRLEGQNDSNLYVLDLQTGQKQLVTPHDSTAVIRGGTLSSDGDRLYLATNIHDEKTNFGFIDLTKETLPYEVLAEREDAIVDEFCICPTGRNVAVMWNSYGRNELSLLSLDSGEIIDVELPGEAATQFSFSADGKRLAFLASGATQAPNIYVLNLDSTRIRKVTKGKLSIPASKLASAQLVRFTAHDGLELSGWLYRPNGNNASGPLVVSFHGGPESQERPMYNATYQALVQAGIAVFAPNIRGSSGFGKSFAALDNGPLRHNAIKDIESCVTTMIKMEIADPARIGVMGISYGGYMTMVAITEYPELFAAAANISGIVNFETQFAETEAWRAEIEAIEYGDPKTQAELIRELSPIHKIDNVRAPTLIIHGANDPNVPLTEARQVERALSRRDHPVKLIVFPDEGHGFQKTENQVKTTTALVEWFRHHVAD